MQKIKKFLNLILNGFFHSSHLTSLSAISVGLTAALLLKTPIDWKWILCIYLAAEIIYLYNRHKEGDKYFLVIFKQKRYFRILFLLLTFAFTGILIISQNIKLIIFGLVLLIFGLFYSIFLKNITKKIIGFKNIFVGLWWAMITVFVYLFSLSQWNPGIFLIFIFIWMRVFTQEVILDMRDLKEDREKNLLTFPLTLDKKLLFNIIKWLTILASIPIIYGAYSRSLPIYSLALIFTIPFNFFIFKNFNQILKNPKYIELWVDGEKILWGILVFIFYKIISYVSNSIT